MGRVKKPVQQRARKDFIAGKHTRLHVRNMRQLPMTLSEAVVRYVRGRKTVAPRPATGSLAQYVMNPRANAFGACDWLHLGADVSLAKPAGGSYLARYTLNLGLRAASDPAAAPPRARAKHFLDEDLTTKPVDFDFAGLGKKLAAKVTARPIRFAVTADAECKVFKLADETASEGVIGRGVLVDIVATNGGKTDVAGVAALAPMVMQRLNPGVWPPRRRGKDAVQPACGGHYRAVRSRREPPAAHNMALFLFDGPRPTVDRLSANAAGYNFGLVAVKRPVTVKAGSAASVPLLFLNLNRPAKVESLDPIFVLDAIKPALKAKLNESASR